MKVLTVGGATQDLFILYEQMHVLYENNCAYIALAQGAKIEINSLLYATGGGATNSATSFSRLGLQAHTCFKRGNDQRGSFIIEQLTERSINTDLVIVSSTEQTGISFIIPSPSKDRAVLTLRGANAHIHDHELPLQRLHDYNVVYISSMTGKSSESLITLVTQARKHNHIVAHNPGSSQLTAGAPLLQQALPFIDILTLNSDEAELLCKNIETIPSTTPFNYQPSEQARLLQASFMNNHFDVRTFCKSVMKYGPQLVAVTDGAHGVYVASHNKLYFHPSLPAEIVNTVGAGDAFGSTFVAQSAQKRPIEQALLSGIINAVSVIESMDATTGLLDEKTIEQRFLQIGLNKLETFEF